jgi:hypothetical protein
MHSLLLTKENLQTRIRPLPNDFVRHIRRQNTHTAGGAGLEPAARKQVVPARPSPPFNEQCLATNNNDPFLCKYDMHTNDMRR